METQNSASEIINEKLHFINRKKILVEKEMNQAQLARKAGCTPQALSNVLRGISHSWRIHRAVCAVLGVELAEFWPEFYGPIKNAVSHDCTVNEVHENVN
jgi:lambda repressor-like predicted transcriptional regulator